MTDFPANLKGGALIKVLTALGNAGLVARYANAPEGSMQLAITPEGLQAIGLTPQQPPKQREGTKQATLIELLKRPEGVSLAEMVQATGWQQHYADVLVMPTIIGNPACVAESAAMKSA